MQLQLLLLLHLLLVSNASCNSLFSPKQALLFSQPPSTGNQSAFGFRTGLVVLSGRRTLLVSDPIGYSTDTKATSGVVYACQLTEKMLNITKGPINQKLCDKQLKFNFKPGNSSTFYEVFKFGASIATIDNKGFAVCAPGYNQPTEFDLTAAAGLCGLWRDLDQPALWLSDFFRRKPTDKSKKATALCLGGFDAALGLEGDKLQLGVSGPFCEQPSFNILRNFDADWKNNSFVMKNSMEEFRQNNVYHQYFGFAATRSQQNSFYATSPIITESDRLIYEKLERSYKPKRFTVDGEFLKFLKVSFSYIGYSIAAVTNRGTDYIVLGAPFMYTTDLGNIAKTDTGCIFVIRSDMPKATKQQPARYCVTESKARFGSSVVALGDINADSFGDFAVGCPGCGGKGAVYIFFGSSEYETDQLLQPAQILYASALSDQLDGFGFSLAAGKANDDSMTDLVVGCTGAGHVALLTSNFFSKITVYADILEKSLQDIASQGKGIKHQISVYLTDVPRALRKARTVTLFYRFEEVLTDPTPPRFRLDCEGSVDGWCKAETFNLWQNNKFDSAQLALIINLIPTANGTFGTEAMLDGLKVRMKFNISMEAKVENVAFSLDNSICENLQCETVKPMLKFKPLSNKETDLQLKLLSKAEIELREQVQTKVKLQVVKPSRQFYGGTAIRVNATSGINIVNPISSSLGETLSYFSETGIIQLTPALNAGNNFMTESSQKEILLEINLHVSSSVLNSAIEFELISLAPSSLQSKGFATTDPNLSNNRARVDIRYDSSAVLQVYRKRGESTIVDIRRDSQENKLLGLTGLVPGSEIGPELMQVYKLSATTTPALPVENIELDVSLPFLASKDDLLLFFPRETLFGSHGTNIVPGLPYITSTENGSLAKGDGEYNECRPMEPDLEEMLHKPNIRLLEGDHKFNTSTESLLRKRRSVISQTSLMSQNSTVSFASSDTVKAQSFSRLSFTEVLDCDRLNMAPFRLRCITFRCNVSLAMTEGSKSQEAYLHIHARLWTPTFFKRKLGIFTLKSSVKLKWKPSRMFLKVNVTSNANFTQTFLFKGVKLQSEEFPWGYVVLAIFIGLWLLLLFILLLWYCGFFDRKRAYKQVSGHAPPEDDNFYQ